MSEITIQNFENTASRNKIFNYLTAFWNYQPYDDLGRVIKNYV